MTDLDLDKLEADAEAAHADDSDWSWFTEWLDDYGYASVEMATHIDNAAPPKFLALIERLRAAEARVAAVRKCHPKRSFCWVDGDAASECRAYRSPWPCPTIEALGEES